MIEEEEKSEEEIEMEEMFESDEEEIDKTFKRAERLIEDVHFNTELVNNEECDRCHHVKPKLVKFTALIGLKSKNGVVIDGWWHSYCLECLSSILEENIKIEEVEIAGYM